MTLRNITAQIAYTYTERHYFNTTCPHVVLTNLRLIENQRYLRRQEAVCTIQLTEDMSEPQGQVFLHGQQAGFMSTGQPLVILLHVPEAGDAGMFGAQGAAHDSPTDHLRKEDETHKDSTDSDVMGNLNLSLQRKLRRSLLCQNT